MKKVFLILTCLLVTSISIGQTLIAKTEDGRRVVLNEDKTWSFIDLEPTTTKTEENYPVCNLPADFEEPEVDRKIQGWLKKFDAQVEDLKKHVAVDNGCSVDKIKVTSVSEQKGNGNYVLCVKGKEMRYRRTGSVFHRQGVSPIGKY
ncbi:DUF3157 domain-containing protein [Nonlabens agnitus]|uniref:DUF3157 domain-containing protein n=1 Tax=Nonlabens agnitus TaxID=870484 RepID=A0A2S9WSB5_9FLAO|nr:DUF3157 domain-containing protein [Nonlabens agnitus]PRP66374.1 hypothetical protein BST86_04350 [Nonlabens agnitus]